MFSSKRKYAEKDGFYDLYFLNYVELIIYTCIFDTK